MSRQLLHTPEGVRDIYGEECARKLAVQEKIRGVFRLYGYQDIETPTFEFFDIFKKERGSVGTREMYKFFDRENNTLVLRPDMTPSIARCVAKYYMDEPGPLRLCYLGSTFINRASYQGRLNETAQTGVELIGDDSIDADAEMIAIVIDALKSSGLREFQVELGEVEFYRGLVEEAGFPEETGEELRELIERKNFFGVEELLSRHSIPYHLRQLFLKLPELFGDITQIRLAKSMTSNRRALRAIDRLEKVQEILDTYGVGDYVSYDLGMLSKYGYYTGIIFKAYTYGTGEYLVTGGRYDTLLAQFGKETHAIGFAILIDQLMLALSRQKIEFPLKRMETMLLYHSELRGQGIALAKKLREIGLPLELVCMEEKATFRDYTDYAKRQKIRALITFVDGGEQIRIFNSMTGHTAVMSEDEYIRNIREKREADS